MKKRFLCAASAVVMMIAALCAMTSCFGHQHTYEESKKSATCTEAATVTFTCECGDSYTETSGTALGHDLKGEEGKAATCTEAGYISYQKCSRCSYATEKQVVEATGHCYKVAAFDVPGFETKGSKTVICGSCNDTITTELDSLAVSVPGLNDFIASIVEELSFTLDTSPESVVIRTSESDDYALANGSKTFYAIKVCDAKLFAEEKVLKAYLKFALEESVVALDGTVDPSDVVAGEFTEVVAFNVFVEGDTVAVEQDGERSEAILSEAVFTALLGQSGLTYDDALTAIYIVSELAKCLPQLEELAAALQNADIFNGAFKITDSFEATLALFGESIIKKTVKEDGSYTYSTDMTAFRVLIDAVKDKTVKEAIDTIYGEGSAEAFKNFVLSIPSLTVNEIADYAIVLAENFGFDVDGIFGLVELAVYQINGVSISIKGQLKENGDVTIFEMTSGGDTEVDMDAAIAEWTKTTEEGFAKLYGYDVEELVYLMLYGAENSELDGSFFETLIDELEDYNSAIYLTMEFSADDVLMNAALEIDRNLYVTFRVLGNDTVIEVFVDQKCLFSLTYGPGGFRLIITDGTDKFDAALKIEEKEDGTHWVGDIEINGQDVLDLNAVEAEGVLASLDLVIRSLGTVTNEETGSWSYVTEDEVIVTYSRTETADGEFAGELVVMIREDKLLDMNYTESATEHKGSLNIYDGNGDVAVEASFDETTVEEVTSCEYTLVVYKEGFTALSLKLSVVNGELVNGEAEINVITRDSEEIYDDTVNDDLPSIEENYDGTGGDNTLDVEENYSGINSDGTLNNKVIYEYNGTTGDVQYGDYYIGDMENSGESFEVSGTVTDTKYGEYYIDSTFNITFNKTGNVSEIVFTQSDDIGFTAVYTELENGGNLSIVGTDGEEVMLDLDVTVTNEEDGTHVDAYVFANEFNVYYNSDDVRFTDSYELDFGFVVSK